MPSPIVAAEDYEEMPRLPLAMEVFLKKPGKHLYELHVHLTNISDERDANCRGEILTQLTSCDPYLLQLD